MIETNEFQTQLTDELLDSLNVDVRDELLEYINSVPYIQYLISPDRKRAKDLERRNGRIIVDIAHPHILEDMDYFRESIIYFQRHGVYTKLKPSTRPNSEFMIWLKREVDRCWNGMVRESDGEWIPGNLYFYLNYTPMKISKDIDGITYHIDEFPGMWEGVYLRAHYHHQAKYGGLYNDWKGGNHCAEIASRGCSKSYYCASIVSRNFLLGENGFNSSKVKSIVCAYSRDFLMRDGILNKFQDTLSHCAFHTPFPSLKIKDLPSGMEWKSGYEDNLTGNVRGSQNETLGVSIKDDVDKIRGKRNHPYSCSVSTPKGIKKWGDIKVGDYVFGDDGLPTKVIDVIEQGEQNVYKITLKDGRVTYSGDEHLWEVIYRSAGKFKTKIVELKEIKDDYIYYNKRYTLRKYAIRRQQCVQFEAQEISIDPYTLGIYLGDGNYKKSTYDRLDITKNIEDIEAMENFIPYKIDKSTSRDITHRIDLGTNAKEELTKLGLKDRKCGDKFIPKNYIFNTEEVRLAVINGLLDTDGSCTKDYGVIEYSTKSNQLRDDFLYVCRSLGFNCKYTTKTVNGEKYNRCYIYSNDSRLFNIPRKKARLKSRVNGTTRSYSEKTHIDKIEFYNREQCKCITVDNKSNLYLIDDFIITHNCAVQINEEFGMFPKFMDFYQTSMPNVQEGTKAFGQSISIGTGGSEGSDFSGALELIQNPSGYNVYGIPNYYDKGSSGVKKTIFFFPGYMNRVGFYNKDGVSDVTGAMIDEIKYRVNLKYNSSDPIMLTRRRAETAYTLQDAVMKRDGSLFPSSQLNDRISELDLNPNAYSGMWSGRLAMVDGSVCYKPDNELHPIMDFPHKNNKLEGAVHIVKMPEKDSTGKVPSGRYIAGADVYDDDTSNTMSLGSMYVMDLWTDDLVFEYTGRPTYADEFYEICRLACIFYNAELNYENNKKGLFKYFSQHNSLYLLSDTLDFLKDKEQYKVTTVNNKSKGTGNYGSGTSAIAPYARRCIRDYLLRECEITRRVTNQDGTVEEETVNAMKLFTIKYRALLKELAMWSDDMNTDRVDALAMLMLLREDRLRLSGEKSVKDAYSPDVNYLGNDDFFNKNYKDKNHKTYM